MKSSPSSLPVCFIGKNISGTWTIRGEQIASARANWKATLDPSSADLKEFDVFCVVKHPVQSIINDLRRKNKTIVYDVLDSWAQPADGLRYTNLPQVKAYFAEKWRALGIPYFIFPNRTMKVHLGELIPYCTYIYHHYWPQQKVNTVRSYARIVAYEGNANYLGEWETHLTRICEELGLQFVVNPPTWEDVDIAVAVRGGEHDSFLANQYKSNVKLANCYGAGVPAVAGDKEMSCHETDTGDVRFFRTADDLRYQLHSLLDEKARSMIHERFVYVRPQFSLSAMADAYEHFFRWAHAQDTSGRALRRDGKHMQPESSLLASPNLPASSQLKPLEKKKQKEKVKVKSPERTAPIAPAASLTVTEGFCLNLGCGDKKLEGYVNVDVAASRKGVKPEVLSDIRHLAFRDNAVAEILSVHVIEHVYHWEAKALLEEWKRVLRPGGRIVVECPNLLHAAKELLENPQARSRPDKDGQTSMWVFYGDPNWNDPLMCHRWGYTPESLRALLEDVGFADVHQEPAQFKKKDPRDMRIVGSKSLTTE